MRLHYVLRSFVSTLLVGMVAVPIHADDVYKPLKLLAQPFKAVHRERPVTGSDGNIEELANQIDWLEHHIDKYGSIAAKHPDVWGQSRLMRHRYEYEKMLAAELGSFQVRMNAALSRSDQAFVGMAFALQAATTGELPSTFDSTTGKIGGDMTVVNQLVPSTDPAPVDATKQVQAIIGRTSPFTSTPATMQVAGSTLPGGALSLEPTIQLDQMSRYINHLHELRRINEGDDIADSPGYALNLVRIPVSILPGKQTDTGYGAEITVTAEPYLSPELLPITMRNMIVNDVVDLLAPVITHVVNDSATQEASKELERFNAGTADRIDAQSKYSQQVSRSLKKALPLAGQPSKTRRARLPIPVSQVVEVIGEAPMSKLCEAVDQSLSSHPSNQPEILYTDVRNFIHEELEAAYELLKGQTFSQHWQYASPALVDAIRERRVNQVCLLRDAFLSSLGSDPTLQTTLHTVSSRHGTQVGDFPISTTTTAALAWAILVEAALLNERLVEDMREAAQSKGCQCVPDACGPFIGPEPSPEARAAFNAYVRCRWPVRVFALDPVTQDQNIADAFARRREMQVAVALAFASGQLDAQAMMRYTRRLEWDMSTIAINQTTAGFSQGNDTFGWRFHPRFQTPPVKGTLATFGETILGGPSTDSDLRSRKLEPGIRECTAIVVMPSFVPYMTFDVRTNWFKLNNPKCSEISMKQTMTLSRSIQSMKHSAALCATEAHLYRDGEVHRLLKRVDQLDAELPLQTMQAQIPYENTSGGFELFNTGITDLAPELNGWYGAPGLNPNGPTKLFLVGKGFSLHSTQIIAGGRSVPFELISRQILEVEIPAGVQVLKRWPGDEDVKTKYDEVVDVHLATPYGVSSHLLVPVAKAGAALASSTSGKLAWKSGQTLTFNGKIATDPSTKAKTLSMSDYFQASSGTLAFELPNAVTAPATVTAILWIHDADTGAFIGTVESSAFLLDASNNTAYLTGAGLTTTATALKTLLQNYIDWLMKQKDPSIADQRVRLRLTGAVKPTNDRPVANIGDAVQMEVRLSDVPY